MAEHQCKPETKFTILAGVVSQCKCGIVHRVSHKTVVETPVADAVHNDPQVTFDDFLQSQIEHALQDLEADNYDHDAPQHEDPEAGF